MKSGLWIDRTRGLGIADFTSRVPENAATDSAYTTAEEAAFRRTYALLPH